MARTSGQQEASHQQQYDAQGSREADDHRLFSLTFAQGIFRVVLFVYVDFELPHAEYAADTLENHTGWPQEPEHRVFHKTRTLQIFADPNPSWFSARREAGCFTQIHQQS